MRIIGLDVGTKFIGVAVSDETLFLARGLTTLDRKDDKTLILEIKEIINTYDVGSVVVGHPLNMNGTSGERAEDSVKIAELIKTETGLEVFLWDERLSTKEAEDMLIDASMSRKKRKKIIDKLAAQLILQGYLDKERNG